MTKVDNILMFFCMSAFFAGLVIAVATLPVWRRPRLLSTPPPSPRPSSASGRTPRHIEAGAAAAAFDVQCFGRKSWINCPIFASPPRAGSSRPGRKNRVPPGT